MIDPGLPKKVAEQGRKITFGALAGFLIANGLRFAFPDLIPETFTDTHLSAAGLAVGTAANNLLDMLLVRTIFLPIARFTTFYSKHAQLHVLNHFEVLGKDDMDRYRRALNDAYFIGEILPSFRTIDTNRTATPRRVPGTGRKPGKRLPPSDPDTQL
jgi:hypothetical protein